MPFFRRHRRLAFALTAVLPALMAVALSLTMRPEAASAHPLGNFTINHYARVEVSETGIDVYRVLDMAEIPAFQERQSIDTNGDGAVDDAESRTWASARAAELRSGITLTVNGDTADLADVASDVTFPEGQGGLFLIRLTARYRAALPDDWRRAPPSIEFTDDNYPDRIGWREIIVRGAPGVEIAGANVPAQDISNELLAYPSGSLRSPLDVRSATFSFQPGAGSAPITADPDHVVATRGNPDGALGRFADLIGRKDMSVGFVLVALLAAMGFGAIHALSPGHGKTIVAAYLIGSRGTAKHAMLLGLTVTATHTSSVYTLGFITLYLSEYIVPETLYPWLSITSGALIVTMGLSLLFGRLRSAGAFSAVRARVFNRDTAPNRGRALTLASATAAMPLPSPTPFTIAGGHGSSSAIATGGDMSAFEHAHDHDGGDADSHDHDTSDGHKHGWGPAHSHAIPGQDGEPVTWQRLIGLGIFGGLLPCPSAIVVMLSAVALHRVAFGLLLILFFSIGLAGVLTGIGFALVYSKAILRRVPLLQRVADRADGDVSRFIVRAFPIGSAAAVMIAGLVITLRAVAQQGWL